MLASVGTRCKRALAKVNIRSMVQGRRGGLSLREHATLRARLRHDSIGRRALLASFGLDEAGFADADEAWSRHLNACLESGQAEDLETWYAAFSATRADLVFLERSAQGISNQAALPPRAVDQPATIAVPEASQERGAHNPSLELETIPSLPHVAAKALKGIAINHGHETGQRASTVPTGTALSPQAEPPAVETRTVGGLTLDAYAKISAELSTYPDRRLEVFARHNIEEAAYNRAASAWKRVIANEGLSAEYMGRFARHHASLSGSRS